MNDIITNRDDLFLAKVAGRDVDISTMTPPVAASMREKLLLEIADRIDQGGGGGSSLPDMSGQSGKYLTNDGTDASWGDVPRDIVFIHGELNFPNYPENLNPNFEITESFAELKVAVETDKPIILRWHMIYPGTEVSSPESDALCNARLSSEGSGDKADTVIITSNFVLSIENRVANIIGLNIYHSSNRSDPEITLMNASASESGIPLVITGTSENNQFTPSDNTLTAESIRDALAAHRPVYIDIGSGDAVQRLYYKFGGYTSASSYTYEFSSEYELVQGKLTVMRVVFDNIMTGTVSSMTFTPDA